MYARLANQERVFAYIVKLSRNSRLCVITAHSEYGKEEGSDESKKVSCEKALFLRVHRVYLRNV
jgi:hypothetical protein